MCTDQDLSSDLPGGGSLRGNAAASAGHGTGAGATCSAVWEEPGLQPRGFWLVLLETTNSPPPPPKKKSKRVFLKPQGSPPKTKNKRSVFCWRLFVFGCWCFEGALLGVVRRGEANGHPKPPERKTVPTIQGFGVWTGIVCIRSIFCMLQLLNLTYLIYLVYHPRVCVCVCVFRVWTRIVCPDGYQMADTNSP